ncbi:SCO family protein [Frigidibacter sp. MR17.24]|uniref:SCO family protein n=1 Tax=Frigidibacter sp. MR17.24 TaxID=3127345 RepID=UPI003012A761
MAISTGRLAAAATAFVAIGLVVTYALTRQAVEGDIFADCRQGVVSGAATIGGPFTLTDQAGRRVTDREVITGPTLVYFGYTFCPDVCPIDAARNAEATDALEEMGYQVTPVFVTVDPKRDTPEVLADYTALMHPRMIGLTGSEADVDGAAKAYKVYYRSHEGDDPEFYLVDHSTQTYLMFPKLGFAEFFNRDVNAQQMAERSACFIEAARAAGI